MAIDLDSGVKWKVGGFGPVGMGTADDILAVARTAVFETDEQITTIGLRIVRHFDIIFHFCFCLDGSLYHSYSFCLICFDVAFVSGPWIAHPPHLQASTKVHFVSCSSISGP